MVSAAISLKRRASGKKTRTTPAPVSRKAKLPVLKIPPPQTEPAHGPPPISWTLLNIDGRILEVARHSEIARVLALDPCTSRLMLIRRYQELGSKSGIIRRKRGLKGGFDYMITRAGLRDFYREMGLMPGEGESDG